ncbi:unnamed protein product [Brugia pahangi]|uniref:Med13_N domain-containing protein n=1 Tax=Brugia pahangi TaxID=6280 RepID=A0A0N4SXK9_BRUPA|nr:unnamed protein product [Brugia pahangi]
MGTSGSSEIWCEITCGLVGWRIILLDILKYGSLGSHLQCKKTSPIYQLWYPCTQQVVYTSNKELQSVLANLVRFYGKLNCIKPTLELLFFLTVQNSIKQGEWSFEARAVIFRTRPSTRRVLSGFADISLCSTSTRLICLLAKHEKKDSAVPKTYSEKWSNTKSKSFQRFGNCLLSSGKCLRVRAVK